MFRYKLGIKRNPRKALKHGLALHETLAYHFDQKKKDGKGLKIGEAKEFFVALQCEPIAVLGDVEREDKNLLVKFKTIESPIVLKISENKLIRFRVDGRGFYGEGGTVIIEEKVLRLGAKVRKDIVKTYLSFVVEEFLAGPKNYWFQGSTGILTTTHNTQTLNETTDRLMAYVEITQSSCQRKFDDD